MFRAAQRGIEDGQGLGTSGGVAGEIETAGCADRAVRQTRRQRALLGCPLRTMLGQVLLDLFRRQGGQRDDHGPRADGRQQFAGIFGQQKNRGKLRRLLQTFSSELAASFMKEDSVKM